MVLCQAGGGFYKQDAAGCGRGPPQGCSQLEARAEPAEKRVRASQSPPALLPAMRVHRLLWGQQERKRRWHAQHTHMLCPAACPGGDLSRAERRVVCRQAGRMLKLCQSQRCAVPAPAATCASPSAAAGCACMHLCYGWHRCAQWNDSAAVLPPGGTYLGHPLTRHPWHHGIQSLRCISTCHQQVHEGQDVQGAYKSTTHT